MGGHQVIIGSRHDRADDQKTWLTRSQGSIVSRPIFDTLQAGRGAAAILIILFHLSGPNIAAARLWDYPPLGSFFSWGYAGVDLFFVLSGFLIFYVHGHEGGTPTAVPRYIWKRVRRIYPLYWIISISSLAIYFLRPELGDGHERDISVIISSFLLIHIDSVGSILNVAWTLYYEILFYAVFSLYILNKMLGLSAGAVFLGLAVIACLSGWAPATSSFWTAPHYLLFAMGILAAWIIREDRWHWPKTWIFVGSILLLGTIWNDMSGRYFPLPFPILAYGVAATCGLLGLVQLERAGRLRVPPFPVMVGNASYAIYLTHLLTISAMSKLFSAFHSKSAAMAQIEYIALVVISITVGLLVHRLVERPLLRWLSRDKVRPAPARAADLRNETA
jgi:exopolysaccharide production protein ExoZ